MHKWLVGHIPLNVNFVRKVNHPWCGSSVHQRLKEIRPKSYLHRTDYNAVWNLWQRPS